MGKGCFCHFNGYEVKDAKARSDIEKLNDNIETKIAETEEYISNEFEYIKDVAEGKTKSYVFDTYESMILALGNDDGNTYKVGDNLYIKDVNVPDYWISVVYVETGSIGHYDISPLETQKVELGGDLYVHNIRYIYGRHEIAFQIINKNNTPITTHEQVRSFLYANGMTNENKGLFANYYNVQSDSAGSSLLLTTSLYASSSDISYKANGYQHKADSERSVGGTLSKTITFTDTTYKIQ